MILLVDVDGGGVELLEPHVLNQFHVSARGDVDAVVRALEEEGRAAEKANHLWVPIALLRSLAEGRVEADWEPRFEKMLDFARGHGWVDEAGTHVMAHLETSA